MIHEKLKHDKYILDEWIVQVLCRITHCFSNLNEFPLIFQSFMVNWIPNFVIII